VEEQLQVAAGHDKDAVPDAEPLRVKVRLAYVVRFETHDDAVACCADEWIALVIVE
jgi:hypothetical protein